MTLQEQTDLLKSELDKTNLLLSNMDSRFQTMDARLKKLEALHWSGLIIQKIESEERNAENS